MQPVMGIDAYDWYENVSRETKVIHIEQFPVLAVVAYNK